MAIGTGAAILGAGALVAAGSYFSGQEASDAARDAANIQTQGAEDAMAVLREDLAPFTSIGTEAANMLLGSVLQPDQAQVSAQDVLSDPFFRALAEEQERTTLAQRSGLGLGGSGGTQELLQRNLLQLGEGFRQQQSNEALARQQARFNQLFGVAGMGQSSAAQTGQTSAGLLTDIATAQSTVPLVQGQTQANLIGNLANLGGTALGLYGAGMFGSGGGGAGAGNVLGAGGSTLPGGMSGFSDSRLKNNIVKVGSDEFGNIYEFSYNGVVGRYKGRIAQELQSVRPDAVSMHESGYLQVSDEFRSELV